MEKYDIKGAIGIESVVHATSSSKLLPLHFMLLRGLRLPWHESGANGLLKIVER
jgi:hypothetical protein